MIDRTKESLADRIQSIIGGRPAQFQNTTASNASGNTVPESPDALVVGDAGREAGPNATACMEDDHVMQQPPAKELHRSPLVSAEDIAAFASDGRGIPAPRHSMQVDISKPGALRHTITARLTDADYKLLCDGARESRLDHSSYLRQLIQIRWIMGDTGPRIIVIDRLAVMAIARELTRWGYHYNQAVHALNAIALRMKSQKAIEQQWLDEELEKIELTVNQIHDMREDIFGALGELCSLPTIRGQ